jgi:esterase/lipase superfamily enzyme
MNGWLRHASTIVGILMLLVAAATPEATTRTHEVSAEVVSIDVTMKTITYRDEQGTEHIAPVTGKALDILKVVETEDRVILVLLDNEKGEHEAVVNIRFRHETGSASPPAYKAPPPTKSAPPPVHQPPQEVNKEKNFARVTVYYATDRKLTGKGRPEQFYGGEPGSEELSYGTLEVSIPRYHIEGEMESPHWWRLEFRPDPQKHVVLLNVSPTSQASFYKGLRKRIAISEQKEALVFIHGYNTTFEDAARRTAQISYDLAKLSGTPPSYAPAPILYSWPSKGEQLAYTVDENNVEWTVPHLKRFLAEVSERSGAETVHLVAHSMGNRALARALDQLAGTNPSASGTHFHQVVLAAPDIDARIFQQLAKSVVSLSDRTTLYASSNDEALAASRRIHGGFDRAGESGTAMIITDGLDTIDASSVKTGFYGHSYYGDSPTVLSDLLAVLQKGLAPGQRHLKRVSHGTGEYWILNP